MSKQIDMTEGSIFSKLMKFSLPLIISNLLQLMFNAADVIVVGRFAGDNSLAAVGSTGSLINLLVNLFTGLSIGTNVVAANYFGAKRKGELKETVHTAILLSLISGLILTAIGVTFTKPILKLMQAPEEVLNLAALYLKVYFGGITATMIYNFGSALLRAKGDTERPLFILFIAGILNVLLNLLFVIKFKMDVAGVALATVISQVLASFLVILILLFEKDDFKLDLKMLKMNGAILAKIIKIGLPAGLQGIVFSFSNVIIQSSINSFGPLAIAGNSAASNIEGFVYTSMNGFSQGALTFCSQNMGAGKLNRIKKLVFISQIIIIIIGEGLGWFVYLTGPTLLGFYSKNPQVIEHGMIRLSLICTTYALCGMMDCMANTIRGIGHSLIPMIVTLIGACGLRLLYLATVFQLPAFHSEFMIFLSYPISWFVTYAFLVIAFILIFKKKLDQFSKTF
ncbi:MAG: MATE family efflux transporter [Treponema sp.]|nr:MATE family efflux transporter [Treponema sp.]